MDTRAGIVAWGPTRGEAVRSDEDLMIACRDGAADAFEELFGRYRAAVWGFFRRRLDDGPRAEDLSQETFVAVLHGAARYEPRAPFRSYLFGIAFNLLSAERRRVRAHVSEPLADTTPVTSPPEFDTVLWVQQALSRLDDSDREIVMLREFEQLSYAEIGVLLDLPLNTVRSRLFRARMELRRFLDPGLHTQGERS
jgi:RNA polymerase sigma-70 factor (ECF subfamily)